jgi:hypothetical protein
MSCPETTTLIDHVDGELTENQRRELSFHLEGCAVCTSVVEELGRISARLGPDEDEWAEVDLVGAVSQRIEQREQQPAGRDTAKLPATRRGRRRWLPWTVGGLAAAAAAALLVVLVLPALRQRAAPPHTSRPGVDPGGFAIRGGKDDASAARKWVKLWIYRSTKRGYRPVRDRLPADARLVFGYRNAKAELRQLMIVAVTAQGQRYWYYPAMKANAPASSSRTGVPIRLGKHELPDETRHPLPSGELRLYALFARRALTVGEVGTALNRLQKGARAATGRGKAKAGVLELPGVIVLTRELQVGTAR